MLDILEIDSTADENPLEEIIDPTSNQEGAEANRSDPIYPCEILPRQELV